MGILQEPDTPLDLRKVAEAAGKSRTAPYLVFGKESEGGGLLGLRIAVAAEGARIMDERLSDAARATADPLLALRQVATAFLTFVDERPRLFRLMYGAELGIGPKLGAEEQLVHRDFQDLLTRRAKAGDVVTAIILESQAQGLLPPDPSGEADVAGVAGREDVDTLRDTAGMTSLEPGEIDPEAAHPSLRYTLIAWASMIGVALLRLDDVLHALRLEIPIDQGARIVTEAVFGLDPEVVSGAAHMFLATQKADGRGMTDLDSSMLPRGEGPLETPPQGFLGKILRRRLEGPSIEERDESGSPTRARPETPEVKPLTATLSERESASSAHEMPLGETITSHHGLRRATRSPTLLRDAPVLWIDDRPESSEAEVGMLRVLGASVDVATGSAAALDLLVAAERDRPYRIIISDIELEGRPDGGTRALEQLRARAGETPIVFYVSELTQDRPVPGGAYGVTAEPDELIHLLMDVLEGRPGGEPSSSARQDSTHRHH